MNLPINYLAISKNLSINGLAGVGRGGVGWGGESLQAD